MSDEKELTEMQTLFVQEYLKDLNATQAALRAGYDKQYARQMGYENLTKPYILKRIRDAMDQRSKELLVDAYSVVAELKMIAYADIGQAFDDKGQLLPLDQMPLEIRRAISGIEVVEEFDGVGKDRVQIGWNKKIKLWDKTKAAEMLAKHLGAFEKDNSKPRGPPPQFIINMNATDEQIEATSTGLDEGDE